MSVTSYINSVDAGMSVVAKKLTRIIRPRVFVFVTFLGGIIGTLNLFVQSQGNERYSAFCLLLSSLLVAYGAIYKDKWRKMGEAQSERISGLFIVLGILVVGLIFGHRNHVNYYLVAFVFSWLSLFPWVCNDSD